MCVGKRFNHCARLRKLPVAITASLDPKNSSLSLKTKVSLTLPRFKTAACTIPVGKSVGTSFKECTAISISHLT